MEDTKVQQYAQTNTGKSLYFWLISHLDFSEKPAIMILVRYRTGVRCCRNIWKYFHTILYLAKIYYFGIINYVSQRDTNKWACDGKVDIEDLKSSGENRVGSIPTTPTILGIGVAVARQTLTL